MTVMDVPSVTGVDDLLGQIDKNVLRIERDGRAAVIMDVNLFEALIEAYEDLEDIRDIQQARANGELEDTISFEELMGELGLAK